MLKVQISQATGSILGAKDQGYAQSSGFQIVEGLALEETCLSCFLSREVCKVTNALPCKQVETVL